jgi:hypothetical protein
MNSIQGGDAYSGMTSIIVELAADHGLLGNVSVLSASPDRGAIGRWRFHTGNGSNSQGGAQRFW